MRRAVIFLLLAGPVLAQQTPVPTKAPSFPDAAVHLPSAIVAPPGQLFSVPISVRNARAALAAEFTFSIPPDCARFLRADLAPSVQGMVAENVLGTLSASLNILPNGIRFLDQPLITLNYKSNATRPCVLLIPRARLDEDPPLPSVPSLTLLPALPPLP